MKKLIAILSLSAFIALGAQAQSAKTTTTKEVKKEVTEVKDDASKVPHSEKPTYEISSLDGLVEIL